MNSSKVEGARPSGYQYFKILSDYLGDDLSEIFNGRLVYPRQLEIHLPGDHRRTCNFDCYYCQGRQLERPLDAYEETALKIVEELKGRIPFLIYGGNYTEPFLNPYLLDFLKATKKNGSSFGVNTNGSFLRGLEGTQSFLSEFCRIATSKQDWLSISLDAGTPASHTKTKNLKVNWFDEIIEGIKLAIKIRGTSVYPTIRVCYLLNQFNSSEGEIKRIIEIMQGIKVDTLRFSIPYDFYGKDFDRVRQYKRSVEVRQNEIYTDLLTPLMSSGFGEKPYIFYLPPKYQDVDKMNFKQCIYGYYQITISADGYIYRCSSTASSSFKFNRLGKLSADLEAFHGMVLANQSPDFNSSTCFKAGARCNRVALEVNSAWAMK